MRKTADVQLRAVTEWRSRQAIERQLTEWNAKLERHVVDQFQLRCYVAALQATELPNPKVRRRRMCDQVLASARQRVLGVERNVQKTIGKAAKISFIKYVQN